MYTVIGKCLGIAPVTRGTGEKAFTQNILGISIPDQADPFGGTETVQVVVGDKVFNEKLRAQIDKAKGQEIQVSIGFQNKVWRGNVQTTAYFNELLPAPNYVKT